MPETKISEFRPDPCNMRLGDIVDKDGVKFLKIKCRRCSKSADRDVFHYIALADRCLATIHS